jgi:hypothetical protein
MDVGRPGEKETAEVIVNRVQKIIKHIKTCQTRRV